MTTREQARAFFDSIAGRYDRVYAPRAEESRARMARVLGELSPSSRVLDLGVGTGRELSSLLDAGHTVVGLDVSPQMLARASRRARPVPLVLADLWGKLPFEASRFDAVIALHGTLAHPPDGDALGALSVEVSRVLARRGLFLFEVPLPRWTLGERAEDDERQVEREGDGRARVSDRATGAAIEARLWDKGAWRDALAACFVVYKALEEGDELFLVATKR